MKRHRLITSQAWKVALILCILAAFYSIIAGIIDLCDSMAMADANDPEELAREISLNMMTTAGRLCISLPSVVISTYLVKISLRLTKGISITLSEEGSPD